MTETRENISSLRNLKQLLVKFFEKRRNSANNTTCDICSKQLQNQNSPLPENVLREVLNYLFLLNQDWDTSLTKVYACDSCQKLFTQLTELAYKFKNMRDKFNYLRKEVGKLLILGPLSKSGDDLEEWECDTKEFETIYPLRLGELITKDVGVGTEFKHTDIKLNQMTARVVLQKLNAVETTSHDQISWIETDLKSENEEAYFLDDETDDFTGPFEDGSENMTRVGRFHVTRDEVPVNVLDTRSQKDIKEEDENTMNSITQWKSQLGQNMKEVEAIESRNKTNVSTDSRDSFPLSNLQQTEEFPVERNLALRQLRKRPHRLVESQETRKTSTSESSETEETYADCSSDDDDFEYLNHKKRSTTKTKQAVTHPNPNKRLLVVPENSETELKSQKCVFCKKSTITSGYTTHLENNHQMILQDSAESDSKNYTCSLCKTPFQLEEALVHEKESHFKCPVSICKLKFLNVEELTNHKKETHGRKVSDLRYRRKRLKPTEFKCKYCLQIFATNETRRRHLSLMHREHVKKSDIPCTHCDLIFTDLLQLGRHKFTAHRIGSSEQKNHQCSFCLKYYTDASNLRMHKKVTHNWKPKISEINQKLENIKCYICMDCPSYSYPENLKSHERSEEHRNNIESRILVFCNLCKINFDGKVADLQEHLKSEIHQNEFNKLEDFDRETFCIPCRQNFNTCDELHKHQTRDVEHKRLCKSFREANLKEDEPLQSPLICHACPKMFQLQKELVKHVQICHPVSEFSCRACRAKFNSYTELIQHRRTHWTKDRPFICEKCGKAFPKMTRLQHHIYINHNIGNFKCKECGATFQSRVLYDRHLKQQHQEARKIECPHCDVATTDLLLLRKHLCRKHPKIYFKDKPHWCPVCYYNYLSKEELDTHMEYHSKLKCYFCGQYSPKPAHLAVHLRIYTGERPYKCSLCDCWFKTNGNLTNHMNAIHKNKKRHGKK